MQRRCILLYFSASCGRTDRVNRPAAVHANSRYGGFVPAVGAGDGVIGPLGAAPLSGDRAGASRRVAASRCHVMPSRPAGAAGGVCRAASPLLLPRAPAGVRTAGGMTH